jgi:hypothetical protein
MSILNEKEQVKFVEDVKYILARNGEQPFSTLRSTMCQGTNRLESLGGTYWKLGNDFYHGEMEDLLEEHGVIVKLTRKKSNPNVVLSRYFAVTKKDSKKYGALPDREQSPGRYRRMRSSRSPITPDNIMAKINELVLGGTTRKKAVKRPIKIESKPYGLRWGNSETKIERTYKTEAERFRQSAKVALNKHVTNIEIFKN